MNRLGITCLSLLALVVPLHVIGQQICNSDLLETTPDSRFTKTGDATVTDLQTALVWQRCPVGYSLENAENDDLTDDTCVALSTTTFNWQSALQSAEDLNNGGGLAGVTDWRLPNIKELASIVEFQCGLPAINATMFPDTPINQPFWSSTTYNDNTNAASLNFASGENQKTLKDSSTFINYVRLVYSPNDI